MNLYKKIKILFIFMFILGFFTSQAVYAKKQSLKEMVCIPEGEFVMGNDSRDGRVGTQIGVDEVPRHNVMVESFCIDKYETSNKEYKTFVDETGNKTPDNITHATDAYIWRDGTYPTGLEDNPVSLVDWNDANAYCEWLGKRLLIEKEWERACRGEERRQFPWGDYYEILRANVGNLELKISLPVYSFPNGVTPEGVYNMVGNVSEWTSSWYEPYPGNTLKRKSFGKVRKVSRGGGWTNLISPDSRCSNRNANYREFTHRTIGIRCGIDN